MNKWSLLLFPVLWLLQSATSERIFVDGRHGRFDYSFRTFLPGNVCSDQTCNEFSDLTVSTRDIRFSNGYVLLKQTSTLNHRPEQRRLFSGNGNRVFSSVPNRSDDSRRYSFDVETFMRNIENSKFRRNLRSVSRKIYGDNLVDRTPYRNNDRIPVKMEYIRERGIDFEQDQIFILRSRNIRNYRRLVLRDDRVARNSRDSGDDKRCNIDIDERFNDARRTYEVIDDMFRGRNTFTRFETRRFTPMNKLSSYLRFIQRENERVKNLRSYENRQKDERYSNRRLREAHINSLQEIMLVSSLLKDGDDFRYFSHHQTEKSFEQDRIRRTRDDRSHRLREETFAERLIRNNRDNFRSVENGSFGKLDPRNQATREAVSERRKNLNEFRNLLVSENRRSNDQTRIRQRGERSLANIPEENHDIRRVLLNNNVQSPKNQVIEKVLRRKHNSRKMQRRFESKELNSIQVRRTQEAYRNRINNDNASRDKRHREESNTNQRLVREETPVSRFSFELRFRTNIENLPNRIRDDLSYVGIEQQNKRRIKSNKNSRERSEASNGNSFLRNRETTVSNIDIHRRIGAVRSIRIGLKRHQESKQLRFASVIERKNDFIHNRECINREDRSQRNICNKYSTRNDNRNKFDRNDRERFTFVEERFSNINPNQFENKMQKEERISGQLNTRRMFDRIDTIERRARTYTNILFERKDNVKENALRRNERASSEENRIKQIREFDSIQKRDIGHYSTRNRNNILEIRVNRVRLENGDLQSKVAERVLAVLKYNEDGSSPNTDRNFGQKRSSLDLNRSLLTRNKDNRIAAKREVRRFDKKADIRDVRHRVTVRPTIIEDLTDKTNQGLQIRQFARNMKATVVNKSIRNAGIHVRKSINPLRDLEEPNKESESYRFNKEITTRVRQIDILDRSRPLISNSRSDRRYRSPISTRTRTSDEERGYRTTIIRMEYDALDLKNLSDSQIFVMKWQYVFYLLQAIYIFGLFKKQKNVSGAIMKKPRFADCFLPYSILKLD